MVYEVDHFSASRGVRHCNKGLAHGDLRILIRFSNWYFDDGIFLGRKAIG